MRGDGARGVWLAAIWGGVCFATAGCSSPAEAQGAGGSRGASEDPRAALATTSAPDRARIRIDGSFDDWPEGVAAIADGDYLYLRFSPGEEAGAAIQASSEQVVLHLDLDGRASTGRAVEGLGRSVELGADLEVRFSPRVAGGRGSGVLVRAFDASGEATRISHADADFMASPTYASAWYEARVSRHLDGVAALAGLEATGVARGVVAVYDERNRLLGFSDPFEVSLPARSAEAPRADAPIPVKPAGALRVVNYNVERGAPMSNPGPFANKLSALDPDVVLVQEWTNSSEADIRGWFNAMLPDGAPWHVIRNETWGVAVVSRHPASSFLEGPVRRAGGATVRFVGARVETPAGSALVGSMHLKCCGGAGSSEDQTRIDEAAAIRDAVASALEASGASLVVLGGDVNLVGTRTPLERLVEGLDDDGSDLAVASAPVLGDASFYTWAEASSWFAPGRLDWAVYNESGAELVHAFVLDTRRLSARTLARHGLEEADSSASDHVPVVIDLRARD
ncbi:MAG: endonuclease/exonuclease/phosphatase family protein [Phycisphaerales bacterium]|nr:MAG: endonuclease/exonuclease/phosphatase family protein [Phycisphaerales bacterium]